jgi:hypothetical protein
MTLQGGARPPPNAQKKKKKKEFGFWGWQNHPQGSRGGFNRLIRPIWGWLKAFGGGPATAQNPNLFLFLFFGHLRVAGPPPKPTGVAGHPLGNVGHSFCFFRFLYFCFLIIIIFIIFKFIKSFANFFNACGSFKLLHASRIPHEIVSWWVRDGSLDMHPCRPACCFINLKYFYFYYYYFNMQPYKQLILTQYFFS